ILRRGTISRYNLSPSAMEPALFVSLLRISHEGGAEVAADWPEKIAREWADSDSYLSGWAIEVSWIHRWAQVNDIRISAVNTTGDGDPVLAAVLVDEYEEELHTYRDIVWSRWFSESGGAPISWDGGYKFSMLSPKLGYIQPLGDDELGSINPFVH